MLHPSTSPTVSLSEIHPFLRENLTFSRHARNLALWRSSHLALTSIRFNNTNNNNNHHQTSLPFPRAEIVPSHDLNLAITDPASFWESRASHLNIQNNPIAEIAAALSGASVSPCSLIRSLLHYVCPERPENIMLGRPLTLLFGNGGGNGGGIFSSGGGERRTISIDVAKTTAAFYGGLAVLDIRDATMASLYARISVCMLALAQSIFAAAPEMASVRVYVVVARERSVRVYWADMDRLRIRRLDVNINRSRTWRVGCQEAAEREDVMDLVRVVTGLWEEEIMHLEAIVAKGDAPRFGRVPVPVSLPLSSPSSSSSNMRKSTVMKQQKQQRRARKLDSRKESARWSVKIY